MRQVAIFMAWQFWQRTVRRPVRVELCPGRAFWCHPHSIGGTGVLYYRLPERGSMRFLMDYLHPGDGFVDVGANIGIYSLLASTVPDVRVLAFEPASVAYGRARENIALNGIEDSVVILPYAAGSADGSVLLTSDLDVTNRVVPNGTTGPVEEAIMVALDGLTSPPMPSRVDVVKVDVEGGELDVLSGARDLIRRDEPALIVEVNDPQALGVALDELGYSCVAYDPERRSLDPTRPVDHVNRNIIAVRDIAAAGSRVQARPSGSVGGTCAPTTRSALVALRTLWARPYSISGPGEPPADHAISRQVREKSPPDGADRYET